MTESDRPAPQTIPVRNVWHMLLYAWDLASFRDRISMAVEASPDLLSLLTRALVHVTADLIRRGVHREYIEQHGPLRHLRGRIDVGDTIRRLQVVHGWVTCAFDELDPNIVHNQILRTTLFRLAQCPALIAEGRVAGSRLHDDVVAVYRRLDGVDILPRLRREHFSVLRMGRQNAPYRLAMRLCELLLDLRLPTQSRGDDPFLGLLENEIEMSRVFEAFVRNFYRFRCADAYDVRAQVLEWPASSGNVGYLPSMRTDVSLTSAKRRLVIDTKFYAHMLTERYGHSAFRPPHLYQLYAYLRTQEDRGATHRAAEGILLYPTAGTALDETYEVQGHRMRITTLDLARPWAAIEDDLSALVVPPSQL